jgi:two-component system response regulator YesN
MTMQITVMLVDDEPLALENVFEMVPWEQHGFEVVAKASNGRMALRLFEELRPQIVITDISMSPMDGLGLGAAIHQIAPQTQLILLTAYRDFEYARKAIEMRAAHYLLKHEISRNRLLNHLLEIKRILVEEANERNFAKRTVMRDLLEGKYVQPHAANNHGLSRQMEERLQGQTALLYFELEPVVRMDGSRRAGASMNVAELQALENGVWKQVDSLIDIELVEVDNQGYVLFLKLKPPKSLLLVQYRLQQVALVLQKLLNELVGNVPKIMIAASTDKGFHPLYQSMKRAYDYSLLLPAHAVFLLEQVPFIDSTKSDSMEMDERWINSPKDMQELRLLERRMKEIVEGLDLSAMRSLIKQLGTEGLKADNLAADLLLGSDATQVLATLYKLTEERWRADQHRLSYSRWVIKAIDYVHKNYADPDLSLETIAASLQISSIHLRTTFKKETGQSVLDYTTEYRISMAKQMLMKGEYKVYEIAERVGYKTSQYFSQVFKKVTGVQPTEYIQREGGG